MPMPEYPYVNFHELNLDWIIKKLKEAYSPDNPPDNLVLSVNGQTGDVILYQDAEVVFPAVDSQAWEIKRYVAGNHTVGIAFQKNSPAMRLNGSTWYDIYDEGNPPPYPVSSVNGQTGDITINVPVQSVNGQTGNVVINVPVQSVNGQTGAVTVPVAFKNNNANYLEPTTDSSVDEWGLQRGVTSGTCGISFEIENGHVVGYINFTDSNDQVIDSLKILTPADIPSSTGVISVNGRDGVVTGLYDATNPPPYPVTSVNGSTGAVALTGDTIPTAVGDNTPLSTTIENAYEESLEDIAIVVKGNKTVNATGASIGQYVVVRNSTITGVSDGLYKAIQAIPYNTVIDSTYLSSPIPDGIANSLSDQIGNVETPTATPNSTNAGTGTLFRFDVWNKTIAMLQIAFVPKTELSANSAHVICAIPSGYRTANDQWGVVYDRVNGKVAYIESASNGNVTIRSTQTLAITDVFRGEIVWFIGK